MPRQLSYRVWRNAADQLGPQRTRMAPKPFAYSLSGHDRGVDLELAAAHLFCYFHEITQGSAGPLNQAVSTWRYQMQYIEPVVLTFLLLSACSGSSQPVESSQPTESSGSTDVVECPVEHGQSCSWAAIPPSIHSRRQETIWSCAIQFHPDDPVGENSYPVCPDICCGERPSPPSSGPPME